MTDQTGHETDRLPIDRGDTQSEDATTSTEDDEEERSRSDGDHLDDIDDGSGCTEIWEQLSEQREGDE